MARCSLKTQMTVKNGIFQKIRKCTLKLDSLPNILKKNDQNIYVTSNLYRR